MNKILLLILLVATQLHAQEEFHDTHAVELAMGDISSIKSSLSDQSTTESSTKKWAHLTE